MCVVDKHPLGCPPFVKAFKNGLLETGLLLVTAVADHRMDFEVHQLEETPCLLTAYVFLCLNTDSLWHRFFFFFS